MSRQVKFNLDEFLLRQSLHMPDDCTIGMVKMIDRRTIEVTALIDDGQDFTMLNDFTKVTPIITKETVNYKWDWNFPEDK